MNVQVQFQLTSKVLCTNTVELYVVIHRIDSDHSAFFSLFRLELHYLQFLIVKAYGNIMR